MWQQCLATNLWDGCVMLAHIPAQYKVTYRRLSQLQSSNCPFYDAQNIPVKRRSFKLEDKFANTVREKLWSNRLHSRQTSTS